jgi:transcriptional regulator with XRE-family HTH domain
MQKDVASAIDISLPTYQRYEYGTRQPVAETLIALSHLYKVSLDYICGIDDIPNRRYSSGEQAATAEPADI